MKLTSRIEDMHQEAETLRSMALATYEAIYNSCTDYKEFDGALNAVFCMAHYHMKHMETLRDDAYEMQRTGKVGE